jgi:UDP-2-acetamido-3-amino-2,3-dideoxy-glucuronate N-acetyltransferase
MNESQHFYVHPLGCCESYNVGENTNIWAFSHVLPGAKIGRECNICDHVFIENNVEIGDRVTVKCGVQLWDGILVENDVFIGPNVSFANDKFPRSKQHLKEYPKTKVCEGASVGANATILPGITIGSLAMVGAGSVVTHDVPPKAVVVGNPARIIGYVETEKLLSSTKLDASFAIDSDLNIGVGDVKCFKIQNHKDLRGSLSVIEFTSSFLPFNPKRQFIVYNVPSGKVRGEHAHFKCEQFLVAVCGSLCVIVDDGYHSKEIQLGDPSLGLYLPPMTWGIQYKFSSDSVLLVLASELYDPNDYIRSYDEFIKLIHSNSL